MKIRTVKFGKTERVCFSETQEMLEIPDLVEIQKDSYKWFLEEGLRDILREISGISDYSNKLILDFTGFSLKTSSPNYSVEECKEKDATYAAPLRIGARLINRETGEVKESEVFMGDFPLMTESGTFVINGAERVVISQMVRSPGIYFKKDYDRTGKELFSSGIIPSRGAWLEFENDSNDVIYVRIDKNRKVAVTTFIRSLGLGSDDDILNYFGEDERIKATLEKDMSKNTEEALFEIYRRLRPGEPPTVESAQGYINTLLFDPKRYDLAKVGRHRFNKKLCLWKRIRNKEVSRIVADPLTGEVLAVPGEILSLAKAMEIENCGVCEVYVNFNGKEIKVISNGVVDISKFVDFDAAKECGIRERVRFNILYDILKSDKPSGDLIKEIRSRKMELIPHHIVVDDIFASVNYMICLLNGIGDIDDIDHLGNRRIRSVGELLQNQFRIGFARLERVIRERMTLQSQDLDVITPHALINIRPIVAAIKEFFGSSRLMSMVAFLSNNWFLLGHRKAEKLWTPSHE
jgi:DNA-directed RNA polymerase subunit beta